ncbi:hypothetical protein BT96DRAFT_1000678 [Gymnopus androsaceus JB14]|uniref:Uncharacterized protein n=1 Tax=Gymnopus androsaceus JB14 TaxID=1447944 RepID=A0A6A4H1S6_9AGAR|nr:hypothetical protein BT96DRAFT_1000678 [Gymnopus androsaceus JB14]
MNDSASSLSVHDRTRPENGRVDDEADGHENMYSDNAKSKTEIHVFAYIHSFSLQYTSPVRLYGASGLKSRNKREKSKNALDFRLLRNFDVSERILGNMVAAGQVSENANIRSALENCQNPYNHLQLPGTARPTSPRYSNKSNFLVPACNELLWLLSQVKIVGPYTDEVDKLEPDFRVTFNGPNYERLEK